MKEIIECVPNFSTSDSEIVKAILDEVRGIEKAYLLDYTYDDYYSRLVVSYVGNRDSVLSAAINTAKKAIELINMNKHEGQHPRIGAVDVVPFIPIRNVEIEDCVELARKFGRTLTEECGVPIYLYGEAATKPERNDLDWVRRGEYEKLEEMMKKPERKPDFGSGSPHPTAGATITGARQVMVGFNVNLGTSNMEIARKIAKAMHAKKGGLAYVKAMATEIPNKNMTQIGMSITSFEKTPLHRVFELIRIEANRYNVPIVSSEFCGLAPLKTITDAAQHYLKIDNLTEDRVLEIAIQRATEKG
ncbi:MAG: glutamate formimidoyltransferase [Candidatus Bathyarchaeota archaeon]|nr:MAG: glutamate formimidoyltransferase [Candidatus Bathyarchaeota archaeon]